jgi:hypothetical protein
MDSTFDYDVALSFAGEDRTYVQQVAALLHGHGIRIFYDEYMTAELWGNDLYVLLDEVYRERARFAVAFVSRHYISKPWTRHERQSAQARAFLDVGPYLLPVRLDDSELPENHQREVKRTKRRLGVVWRTVGGDVMNASDELRAKLTALFLSASKATSRRLAASGIPAVLHSSVLAVT